MSNKVGGISNIRATDGGNIASFRSNDSKIGQYIDVNSERAVINYMENGEWKTGFVIATKSDLNNAQQNIAQLNSHFLYNNMIGQNQSENFSLDILSSYLLIFSGISNSDIVQNDTSVGIVVTGNAGRISRIVWLTAEPSGVTISLDSLNLSITVNSGRWIVTSIMKL